METVPIPDSLINAKPVNNHIDFVPYTSETAVIKGRAILNRHMISLITEGEKVMYVENNTITLTPQHLLILSSGNTLFTERLGRNSRIKSTMIFFNDAVLREALQAIRPGMGSERRSRPFILLERDLYLHTFIESVSMLMDQGLLSPALQRVKLNELLLYLESKSPGIFAQFHGNDIASCEEERIRTVMEAHSLAQLSLQELAFLCHMSLPTFKRKFEQVYHESPARWLQIQRLTMAADRLRSKTSRPGEVYLEAGYQNHSSFSKAFKQYFGVLPKDYLH
ncbi:helix-turn-helix domain-containing protein [Desertivirga brevis]|uniref:helix-turn-helix domain-containing protein n=1 Tax=Desertivirga brevis TaxID=2810310 RepID=UPI001A959706|nr:AraC family transcriptional regulator [Pedobacter sp. SYSU D00873]